VFLGQGVADFICTYGFSMVAISYMFGLHFAITFLQGHVFAPRVTKVLRIIGHSMWVLVLCNIAGWRTLVIREEQLISLLTPVLVIVLATSVYREKYRPALYFLIAWSLLLVTIIYFAASVMGLLPVQSWTLHALTIGSGIEMILLSFALGFRYLLLKRETSALQQSGIEMMKEHNTRLEREVTVRTQELQQALVSLTASNEVKDRLLGIISHDFRTPLNNLYWLLDQIDPRTVSIERIGRLKLDVSIELKRISMTMDNILNWSLTQMNRIEARPQRVLLPVLFQQVTKESNLAAKKKNVTLIVNVPDDIMVWADNAQLRLVLLNLLHNAVKFTNEGGTVMVSAAVVTGTEEVEISVTDNGIGMTQEEADQLLHEKNVHSRQGTANEAGTGMGILLCKEFVAANGGSLQLESHVNKGARFYFNLPANKQ
jgi:signal transduction histidine kinase